MRLDKPRIEPRPEEQWDPALRERFEGQSVQNIFRVLANHPALARRWMVFANHVLSKSTLPPIVVMPSMVGVLPKAAARNPAARPAPRWNF